MRVRWHLGDYSSKTFCLYVPECWWRGFYINLRITTRGLPRRRVTVVTGLLPYSTVYGAPGTPVYRDTCTAAIEGATGTVSHESVVNVTFGMVLSNFQIFLQWFAKSQISRYRLKICDNEQNFATFEIKCSHWDLSNSMIKFRNFRKNL